MADTKYVYIIAEAGGGFLKIGVAKNPGSRAYELQTGNPRQLQVMHTFRCKSRDIAHDIERAAHEKLFEDRVSGEWFECSLDAAMAAIEAAIKAWKPPASRAPTSAAGRSRWAEMERLASGAY